jgi:hypothetical protein
MGAIRHTTKKEVLQRAASLLESSNTRYRNRVFVMAGSDLPPNVKDHDVLTVSIAGGTFAYAEQSGAGQFVVPYQGTLAVSLWHTCRTDRQGTDKNALLEDVNGLFTLQRDILVSLLGSLFPGQNTNVYDPILTQCCYAISDTEASRSADGVFGKTPSGDMAQAVMTLNFGVDFHWDITAE